MQTSNPNLLLFVSACVALSGVQSQPTEEVNRKSILNKFKMIADVCSSYLDSENKKTKRNEGQILCLMVMSAAEIESTRFPDDDGRIKPILNQNRTGTSLPGRGKVKKHGEVIAIHLDNDIPHLIEQFRQKSKTADGTSIPYVFLYSRLIPCSGLIDFPYSCAEEVAIYARLNNNKFNLLVGYSEEYEHTNVTMAKEYLHQKNGIFAIVDISSEQIDMGTDGTFFEPVTAIFQNELHECIVKKPAFCPSCKHCQRVKSSVAKQKLDELIKTCTQDMGSYKGPLTHLGFTKIRECFVSKKWIRCCERGDKRDEIKAAEHCFDDVMKKNYENPRTLLVFGRPKPDGSYVGDENLTWDTIYQDYTDDTEPIVCQPTSRERSKRSSRERSRTRTRSRSPPIGAAARARPSISDAKKYRNMKSNNSGSCWTCLCCGYL